MERCAARDDPPSPPPPSRITFYIFKLKWSDEALYEIKSLGTCFLVLLNFSLSTKQLKTKMRFRTKKREAATAAANRKKERK